jgi:hypothetical protein
MSGFGRTESAGFTVGSSALFFKNPPGPINHPLQDTKLHAFRELERRVDVVSHDHSLDCSFFQSGLGDLRVLTARVGRYNFGFLRGQISSHGTVIRRDGN